MTITPEIAILHDMIDVAFDMNVCIVDSVWAIEDAVKEHEYMTENFCEVEEGVDGFISRLGNAHEYYIKALDHITKFDKQLAELIALRGKFAEETGIPMFSHIGEDKRVPEREEYSV